MKNNITIVDTNGFIGEDNINKDNTIHSIRDDLHKKINYNCSDKDYLVDISVGAYNRLDLTKKCVESILKYTSNIKYRLILIDNGSTDETFEYFKSISYPDKIILRATKNCNYIMSKEWWAQTYSTSKYIVTVPNDVVVTKNWLSNMIRCAESDERIGMVNAMSSNVSNLQDAGIEFKDLEELQIKAQKFNESSSDRWHERMRLITLATLYKKWALELSGVKLGMDVGFVHDFADDEISFRIRRAGFKIMLCKDTFIHHNHDVFNMEHKDPVKYQESLKQGKKDFQTKFYGIDAWDDTSNFEVEMMGLLENPTGKQFVNVLGIDTKCGTPILEVKNNLKEKFSYRNTMLNAYTEEAKYYIDLKTICEGQVECDRVEYIPEHFIENQFDIVLLGKAINLYSEPLKLFTDLLKLIKDDGYLFLKLRNVNDYLSVYNMFGNRSIYDKNYPTNWPLEDFEMWVNNLGYKIIEVVGRPHDLDEETLNEVDKFCVRNSLEDRDRQRLLIDEFTIKIKKC